MDLTVISSIRHGYMEHAGIKMVIGALPKNIQLEMVNSKLLLPMVTRIPLML